LSKIGEFSVEALDLNRQSLRRLREIRDRLTSCDEFVARGITALRGVRIDRLPQGIKGRAHSAIRAAAEMASTMAEAVDEVLRSASQSPLLDADPEKEERREERKKKLGELAGLYPGVWRGRKSTQVNKKKATGKSSRRK
jgi:hypothetical protein